jgi:hypothetical protein
MMTGTDYVVTHAFHSSNGSGGVIDFLPGDHVFLLGQGGEPGWWRAWLSHGSQRKAILFFGRSDLTVFIRPDRHV